MRPEVISSFRPTHLFHLAAPFERTEETSFWDENQRDNVLASAQILRAALETPGLERYVFASSYLVYDPRLYLHRDAPDGARLLREDDPVDPRNVCGAAKLLHERELALASAGRFDTVSARIFRVYGRGSRDVVSRWVRSALAGDPIELFDADGRFDYVFADDVAEGLVRLADSSAAGVVNLATGQPRSVAEVVEEIAAAVGPIAVRDVGRSGRPREASGANTERLQLETGWVPSTQLARGIGELVAHERNQRTTASPDFRTNPRRRLRLLLPSGGAKVTLVRSLQRALRGLPVPGEVIVADTACDCLAGIVADKMTVSPAFTSVDDDQLEEWVLATGANVVVPSRDAELHRWSTLADRFATHGVVVVTSSTSGIDVCVDKLAFANWAERRGLPALPTWSSCPQDAPDRLVVKERHGAGARGAFIDVAPPVARVVASSLGEPVFQPFVAGVELSADFYIDRAGRRHGPAVRRRHRVVGGESVDTKSAPQEPILVELVDLLADDLGLRGPGCAQAIVRADDSLALLEVNARFGGASSAAPAAGLNLPELLIRDVLGEPFPPDPPSRSVRLVRIPTDVILPE
jgi:carbamoyl-phosphate synthase large subunit